MEDKIFNLKLQGYCCSQIITALALEDLGKENEDLILAMGGYCNGLEEGEMCGTLLAAVAVLYLVDTKSADRELRAQLMDWFYDRYGSYDCKNIVHDNPSEKLEVCPAMIEATYEFLHELLGDKL